MEPDKTQDPQLTGDPPLPTFWGDIRNFFIGLPDRWYPDKRPSLVECQVACPGNIITEEEELPTLSGFAGSIFGNSSVDDDSSGLNSDDTYSFDKTDDSKAMGLGWPFFNESMGFSYMDDEF
ncbi:hypothetical protein HAP94_09820 [Acidithiobacillus ferrivorans]|nr:hypothetical protein [Acidithiobacillus ferrivorans]